MVEPVGETFSQVAGVSPDLISQTEVDAEKADEDTHDDCLMPVNPGVAGDEQDEGKEAPERERIIMMRTVQSILEKEDKMAEM